MRVLPGLPLWVSFYPGKLHATGKYRRRYHRNHRFHRSLPRFLMIDVVDVVDAPTSQSRLSAHPRVDIPHTGIIILADWGFRIAAYGRRETGRRLALSRWLGWLLWPRQIRRRCCNPSLGFNLSNLSSSRDLERQPNGRRHGRSTLFMHDSNKAGCRNTTSCTSPLLHGQESPAFFSAGPDPGNLYRLYIDKCMQCRASKVHAVRRVPIPWCLRPPSFRPLILKRCLR